MINKEPEVVVIEDSEIDGMVAGSINDLAIMEQVIQNKLAQKEAEIAELKAEIAAEKEVVLSLRGKAESGLRSVDDERAHVAQQQADLITLMQEYDAKLLAMKAAAKQFSETIESI
jgi:hypothetical protein